MDSFEPLKKKTQIWGHFRNQGNKRETIVIEGNLIGYHEEIGEYYPEALGVDDAGNRVDQLILDSVEDWPQETKHDWGHDRKFGRVRITIEPIEDEEEE